MAVQSVLKSLLAEGQTFQMFMNDIATTFDVPMWRNYSSEQFGLELTWKGIASTLESVPAATVVDYSAEKPIARRPTISELSGDLLTLGDKFQMDKKEVRKFLELQQKLNSGLIPGLNDSILAEILVPDLKIASLSPHQRIDYMMLETLSTGATTLTKTNNPKGIIATALDWDVNKKYVATVWSNVAALPITDIQTVVKYWRGLGSEMRYMLMTWTTFYEMIATTQFKGMFGLNITTGNKRQDGVVPAPSLEMVNAQLIGIGLPEIMIVNKPINVESTAGAYSSKAAFADYRVTFVPQLNDLGTLHYTFANMDIVQDAQRDYAKTDLVSIARWVDGDKEFTEYELNAMWVLNKALSMSILTTNATS